MVYEPGISARTKPRRDTGYAVVAAGLTRNRSCLCKREKHETFVGCRYFSWADVT